MLKTINPASGEVVNQYKPHSAKGIEKIINSSDRRWIEWRRNSFTRRGYLIQNLAGLLRSKKEELARIVSLEMGKVITEAVAEIEKCAMVCEYYALNGEDFLARESVETEYVKSYISYQPLGTVLGIMPWNFPFWQVFRFAIPTLMAGNTVILKHASNVSGCSLLIEDLFREAGFPENTFRSLLVDSGLIESIIGHPAIKGVSLTGSSEAGRSVAMIAGKYLKKCLLELGGSDPYIILEDADLRSAAKICASGRLLNAGQSCIGAKRFIVVEPVYYEFLEYFTHEMNRAVFGDPMDTDVTMGPLAREDLREELHNQVNRSVEMGAEIILGGGVPNRRGFFYPPTILEDVKPGMPAYHEELFGPVASVIKVKDEREAVEIANDSRFGLGAAIFTKERSRGEMIAETKLEAGYCIVNDFVKSDPRLPFGGIKESGYGRELSGFGIKEFVNIKTIVIE